MGAIIMMILIGHIVNGTIYFTPEVNFPITCFLPQTNWINHNLDLECLDLNLVLSIMHAQNIVCGWFCGSMKASVAKKNRKSII